MEVWNIQRGSKIYKKEKIYFIPNSNFLFFRRKLTKRKKKSYFLEENLQKGKNLLYSK